MKDDPRVLIVESNEVLRAMLFTILRHQPVAVDTAATVASALERVAQCDYALIVVDMDMPDDGGSKFVTQFREQRPEATSFVLAVRDPRNDEFLDPGHVSAVLNKPIEIDMLSELVRECAHVVEPPDEPLPCSPAESEIRLRLEKGSHLAN
jgi:two-component system, NtrC family, response regulator PilR